VTSAISAQVLALPTSIAVRKLPCWFAMRYEFPILIDPIFDSVEMRLPDCS
jgi:hypothetical protein